MGKLYGSSALRKGAGSSEVTRVIPLSHHSKISSEFQEPRGASWLYRGFCCPISPYPGAGETAELEAVPLRAPPACLQPYTRCCSRWAGALIWLCKTHSR